MARLKYIRYYLTLFVLVLVMHAHAQDYVESAMMFNRTTNGGSARIQGLGGAQTALGGDYSAAHVNPAGLGMFNRSEFTLSLGLNSNKTTSTFNDNSKSGDRTVFNIPGISYVHHMPDERDGFLGGAFAFSLTRTNDFNRDLKFSGSNPESSIVDYFIDQANGYTVDQFQDPNDPASQPYSVNRYNDPTGLAYDNYLVVAESEIDPTKSPIVYLTDAGYPLIQQEEIETKGATNQWNISYGANFNDKLFIGAGLGITSLKYRVKKHFFEQFDNPDTIENLTLQENFNIRGTGFNATIGAIARPVNFLQLGISYRTPTVTGITETYNASMSTKWNNFDFFGDGRDILGDNTDDPLRTDEVISEYNLRTPSKLSTGLALLSKYGFFTADVDFTNLGKSKYKSTIDGIEFEGENAAIKALYTATVNYRFGAEYRLDIFRIRGGYGVMANTYRSQFDIDNKITTISGGVGIRKKSFYVDFALVNSRSRSVYYPYTFSDGSGPIVNQKNNFWTGMVTVGFTFESE